VGAWTLTEPAGAQVRKDDSSSEIVVTAQRKAENIRHVLISMTALSAERIKDEDCAPSIAWTLTSPTQTLAQFRYNLGRVGVPARRGRGGLDLHQRSTGRHLR
jgi:hypothetical protein